METTETGAAAAWAWATRWCVHFAESADRWTRALTQFPYDTTRFDCLFQGAAAMVMAELEEAALQHSAQEGHNARPLFNGGMLLIEPILLAPDGDRSMIHPLADRALKRRPSW